MSAGAGVPAVADDQSPQKAHGLFGHLHIPRKYLYGCDDPEVYVAPVTSAMAISSLANSLALAG